MTLVVLLVFFTVDAPFSDDYDAILAYIVRPFPERLLHLADFHNEHRIVTARIVFEAVYWIFGCINFRACMGVGAVFLLGYGLLLSSVFKQIWAFAKWYYIPCVWMVVSTLNNDNVCWAMTSVSNVPVLFWTFCSIMAFAQRKTVKCKWLSVATAVVCAILATFSTGAGMFVWFGLLFVQLHEWLIDKGSWSNAWKSRRGIGELFTTEFAVVSSMCVICVSAYLHGMYGASLKEPPNIVNMALFFLSFMGAIIPVFSISIAIGLLFLCVMVVIVVILPRNSNIIATAFLLCLVLCVGAATPFRSFAVDSALVGRYRIIPVSIAVMLLASLLPYFRFLPRKSHVICSLVFSGVVIVYLVMFSFVSLRRLADRNEIVLRAMMTWTKDTVSIIHEKDNGERFSLLLKEAYKKGVYSPGSLIKPEWQNRIPWSAENPK